MPQNRKKTQSMDKRGFGQSRFGTHRPHYVYDDTPDERITVAEKFPKTSWKPGCMLAPVPAVLVSCGGARGCKANILTVAWTGTVCTTPPMLSLSIRPERYSHDIIANTRECVVNIPTARLARATDWCGVRSGRDHDKFEEAHLIPMKASQVAAPMIAECPINLECKVTRILPLGSHDLFLAEVVAVHVSSDFLDKKGKLRLDKAELLAYAHVEYYILGKKIGFFGFSVKK